MTVFSLPVCLRRILITGCHGSSGFVKIFMRDRLFSFWNLLRSILKTEDFSILNERQTSVQSECLWQQNVLF